jgi:ABC-2 type transport system permease protein
VRKALLEEAPTAQLWPTIWPVLLMGLALIPAGLWMFNQAERGTKRSGQLHRNG